jgi:hypothetical protein
LGYQATHVDAEFYERFYQADALSETQRATYVTLQQAQRLQRAA